jgi:transcriptional regulator with XRE-family HTH domain
VELGRSVDATMITRLEQGRRPIAVHELIGLSGVLGVSAVELMSLTSELDGRVQAARVRFDMANLRLEAAEREAKAAAEYLAALADGANSEMPLLTQQNLMKLADAAKDALGRVVARAEPPVEYRADPVIVDGAPTYRVWSSESDTQDDPAAARASGKESS